MHESKFCYSCIIIELNSINNEIGNSSRTVELMRKFENFVIRSKNLCLLKFDTKCIYIYCKWRDKIEYMMFKSRTLTSFISDLRMKYKYDLIIGLGGLHKQDTSIKLSEKEAKQALNYGKNIAKSCISDFESIGVFKLFLIEEIREELIRFCEDTLLKLKVHDGENDTELLATIDAYFKNCQSISKTSKEFNMHYNSIMQRVFKVQEITGCDLKSESERFKLHTAVITNRMMSE